MLKRCIRRRQMSKRYAKYGLFLLSRDYQVVWATMMGNECFMIMITMYILYIYVYIYYTIYIVYIYYIYIYIYIYVKYNIVLIEGNPANYEWNRTILTMTSSELYRNFILFWCFDDIIIVLLCEGGSLLRALVNWVLSFLSVNSKMPNWKWK